MSSSIWPHHRSIEAMNDPMAPSSLTTQSIGAVGPAIEITADDADEGPEEELYVDDDFVYGSDVLSTKSLTSKACSYQKENGRTYHGYRAGIYHFPNDSSEADRLDFQYALLQHAVNHVLHFAPLTNPRRIIDIGTGTGMWPIQMADEYPNAIVEGTDLSPIQPTSIPENVQFIIDDAEQDDWGVPINHYDLIHTRVMIGAFQDFRTIVQKGMKYAKPGGWMESQEISMIMRCDDGSMPEDWPFYQWSRAIDEASMQANRPMRIATRLKKWYIEEGFVDVQEHVVKLPIGTWPKDPALKALGSWWKENLLVGLQGFSLALLSRVLGWSKNQIEVYLVDVRKSMHDRDVHAYHEFITVWGRKPTLEEAKTPAPQDTVVQPDVKKVDVTGEEAKSKLSISNLLNPDVEK